MCGIAGILSLAPDARVEVEPLRLMARQLVHRGPDDEGFHLDPGGRCGLTFRRLSIIDLATGHQPLSNEDGSLWLVFNGEIYNFRDLRDELTALGHRFATQGDSETIVHAFEQWGTDSFARLAGMFAIALWDAQRGELHLARDRLGKKPLVYARFGSTLYFASEAKAILALPGVPRRIDAAAMHRCLVFQYVPAPHSIYQGFAKLPPGTHVTFRAHHETHAEPRRYWQLPHADPEGPTLSHDEAKAELGRRLEQAVARRLVADVPLGAFLSGGVDSSIVVGLMRKLGVQPLRTFSIAFSDPRYDESAHARRVAQLFQTEHHEHFVTPRAAEILDTLAWHFDEPFGDSSAIPTWYVSHYTRQSVTVALTGDGGDECFAGYDRYRALQLAGRLDVLPHWLRGAVSTAAEFLPHGRAKSLPRRLYRFASALDRSAALRYLSWVCVFEPETLIEGYRPEFAERIDVLEPDQWFSRQFDAAGGSDAERANRVDFATYLPYDLLTKVDAASMAVSLECRCPFLDHELVEFAAALPLVWKLAPGGGKHILREYAHTLLPQDLLDRPKMGFGVPVGEWFRGELKPLLLDRLRRPEGLCHALFLPGFLARLLDEHLSGSANHEHRLWMLLMLELWHERWKAQL